MELLIGCGHRREKLISYGSDSSWKNLTTLDNNSLTNPDVLHNLNVLPYPFEDNTFNEIHAYEVLEHCGTQGDAKFFFAQFDEFYRILKPNGYLIGTVPAFGSRWMFGDPSHTRVIMPENFWFLDRDFYKSLGENPASDFRHLYKGNFKLVQEQKLTDTYCFALKAVDKDAG